LAIDLRHSSGSGRALPLPSSAFLPDWLVHHAERTPDSAAVAGPAARLTYGELHDRVRRLAADLASHGIGPGSRVLVALPNTPATVVAGLAVNWLGATSVEVNRGWSPEVLGEIVARSRVRHLIVPAQDGRRWSAILSGRTIDHVWAVHRGEIPARFEATVGDVPSTPLLDDGRLAPGLATSAVVACSSVDPDAPAVILFTSGSTGRPHGVIQTFRNIDANSRSIVEYLGLTALDRAMLTLPLHYCYGRSVLQTHLLVGGSVFLDHRMAFPRTVLETMAAEACTNLAGVPRTFELIRRQVDVTTLRFPHLRFLTQAGDAMTPEMIAWVRDAFRPAALYVMYGQTEATARLTYLPPVMAATKAGSIGIAIPGVELRVVDDQGRELPAGAVGELVARGPNVTPGYLDEPDETARILRDGWLRTGDLVERDADGYLFHRGRAREILKIRGHRVSPVEIERVVVLHPDVAEAAVVGARDGLGDLPVAVIVARSGGAPTEAGLRRFCVERLPAYQVPVRFELVERLPRTESGKLLRSELADRYRNVVAPSPGRIDG
jgi:acyl-CoA synthetase (AMP-forming)/AMP-acid ligase II